MIGSWAAETHVHIQEPPDYLLDLHVQLWKCVVVKVKETRNLQEVLLESILIKMKKNEPMLEGKEMERREMRWSWDERRWIGTIVLGQGKEEEWKQR